MKEVFGIFCIYKTESGAVIVTVSRKAKKSQALSIANRFIKKRLDDLVIMKAWGDDSSLYFKEVEGKTELWAIYKKKRKGEIC